MYEHEKRIRSLVERRDVQDLIVALTDKNMDVRTEAAKTLGDIGDERAVEPLITALNDTTDYPVFKVPLKVPCTPIDARGEAALALGKIGGDAAVEALLAVADTNPEKGVYRGLSVAEAVKRALSELGVDASEVVVPKDPRESPERKSSEEMVKTADDLRWRGQLDEAMEWAVRATDTDPSNGYAWMEMGLIEVDRRDVVAATSVFVKAIDVDPKLKGSEPGARLAVVYDVLGMGEELKDVCASLDRAGLGLDPRAEREWEALVKTVDPGKLRAALGLETSEEIVEAEAEVEAEPVAGVCDICNAPGMGTIVSADQMREAVFRRGFNPFKLGLVMSPMISIVGEQEAYQHWKDTIVAQDTSDWNVCANCMLKLRPCLPGAPQAAGVGESTVSFHPAVSAAAGAAAEQKYQMVTDAAAPPAAAKQTYKIVTDPAVPLARRAAPAAQASTPPAQAAVPKARPVAKEPGKKRRLPLWAIALLVLGAVVLVGALGAVARPLLAPKKEPRVVDVIVTVVVSPKTAEALAEVQGTKTPMPEEPAAAAGYLGQAMAGAFSGTEVSVLGLITDEEVAQFDASVRPFEEASGIRVVYDSVQEFQNILRTRIAAGDPPDIADMPQLSLLADLVSEGEVVDVSQFLDMEHLQANYDQGWLDMATMEGPDGPIMAGVWHRVTTKSLVWYPKKEFDAAGYEVPTSWAQLIALTQQIAADGSSPWCIGMESGAATGWVATDWVENIMLRTTSPETYDQWVAGELSFASPEVRRAVEIMSTIWLNEDYVYGGTEGIVSTSFIEAVSPMLEDPPRCWLHLQGPFITLFFDEGLEAGVDYDFFPLPPIHDAYDTPALVYGNIMVMFDDRPEVRALMEYFTYGASVEAWVKSGGATSPHNDSSLDWYRNDVDRRVAQSILEAETVRFDASDLMPPQVGAGSFWTGMTDYVSGAADLDTVLAEIHNSWPGLPTLTPVPEPSATPTEPPPPTATATATATPAPTAKPTAKPTPVPTNTSPPPPTATPARDLSTLETALLGHWVTESGVTHFYIGPGTMIMVEPSGTMHLTWTRFEGNDEDNWMKIYVHRPDTGGGHYKLLTFAPDRMSLVSETNIAQKWLYVDGKQQP
jgi:alpha-glucoside transport system substrate-binding protein